jgi:radical SAM protein with 4Fe4S-binding SPASM domain
MPIRTFVSANLARAYRLVFHTDRTQRARNFVAWQRHLVTVRRLKRQHDTRHLRSRQNRDLLQRELREQRVVLASHPTTLSLDPAAVCNLRCPFCPTGGGYGGFERALLTPERFSRIVAHLDTDLIQRVELYNWGEPLLNPHLVDFIAYFSERSAETEISTNFSQRDYDEGFLADLVRSGLTTLIVSIDGATQQTYERYRVRGNLERVLGNMRRLAAVKSDLGSDTPLVLFKMLLHRHNQHEVEEARRIAADCGAQFLLNERFWCPDEVAAEWRVGGTGPVAAPVLGYTAMPEEVISTYCRQLWESAIVTATGDVHPCCLTYEPHHAIGNLETQELASIRNGPQAMYLRRLVTDPTTPPPEFTNSCERCPSRWCVATSPARP